MLKLDNVLIATGDFSVFANLEVHKGTTAIIGPSGGGKSSILLAIAGFYQVAAGKLFYQLEDITNIPPAKRPVTLLFQENNLFPHLTVFKNTALGVNTGSKISAAETDQVHDALLRVGLAGFDKRLPSELSGGQRQRVALARALLRDKPVLMLDEPFAALGPSLRHEMLELVAEIQTERDLAVLLVTHNPEDARRIASQTIVVSDGHAYAPEPTAKLLDNPPKALADYLGA